MTSSVRDARQRAGNMRLRTGTTRDEAHQLHCVCVCTLRCMLLHGFNEADDIDSGERCREPAGKLLTRQVTRDPQKHSVCFLLGKQRRQSKMLPTQQLYIETVTALTKNPP